MSAVSPAARPAASVTQVAAWRRQLAEGRATLKAAFLDKPDVRKALEHQGELVDRVLKAIWVDTGQSEKLALVAVGGYGRGMLYPYSDVDVLILLPDQLDDAARTRVEELVGVLWDIGLEIGHSVRTIAECDEEASRDITVQTTLLESRLVAGNRRLFGRFRKTIDASLSVPLFTEAKLLEQEQRHSRFNNTAYNLEPNIKESPGGLRDLQTILWISRAAGLGHRWSDLTRHKILTREEARQLKHHETVLAELRQRLHLIAGRREDRLLFDFQSALGSQYGLTDTPARRASEQLMQRFYSTAKAVQLLNTIILHNLRLSIFPSVDAEPRVINERFRVRNELLEASYGLFRRQPSSILEAFLLLQDHPELKGFAVPTMRALWHARDRIGPAFRKDPQNRELFMQFFRRPAGLTHTLRRLNQYGVLGRYLPAFGRIVGRMQHDLFHVYTVDEHILMVVRNLRRFAVPEMAHEYPLCSRLIAEFERPEVLYLAGLFHDIAKGRGGDHSQLGMADARRFCREHGLSKEDGELVTWLVEQHLFMSATAQKQDLSDPDVIRAFAARMKDDRHLVALYLLTVADIRGTSPKVWNAWKGKLLEDLFRATRRLLNPAAVPAENTLQARQERALGKLRAYAIAADAHKELWSRLDDSYFLRHDETEIVWHTRALYSRVNTAEPIVRARLSPLGEGLQVMIYTPDEKSLFARICGFFQGISFSVVEAKIYTTRHNYALDSFQVMDPARETQHYRDLMAYIEHELAAQLRAHAALPAPVNGRLSRQVKYVSITPQVHIRPDEKGAYHYLSVVAGDRPGLLYRIARVLDDHGIALYNAKVNTLGERAEDTFLVAGDALRDTRKVVELESELAHALQPH
ncbi:MAG TPA: [protein-PII] uridylyltransferase [Burkholderiales bacterium]|jgi:[protein-PII] uridylyltransferase|nr:[protein-PII] uridylyltransferase [Burkholderiales bacterium]